MIVKLYKCNDSYNVLNKTLTDENEIEVVLKDRVNIDSPILKLKSRTIIDSNYCYIPVFKRYYFIRDIVIINDNIQELYLKCDVLESFKNDILNSYGLVKSGVGNKYIDVNYDNEIRKEFDIYESDIEIEYKNNLILSTLSSKHVGGGIIDYSY